MSNDFSRNDPGTWTEGRDGVVADGEAGQRCGRADTYAGEMHFVATNGECLTCSYYSGVKTRTEYLAQFDDTALANMVGGTYVNYATCQDETATIEEIIAVREYRRASEAAWLRDNPQAEMESYVEGPGNVVTEMIVRVFGGDSHNARVSAATAWLEAMTDMHYVMSVDSHECKAKKTDSGLDYVEFRYFNA